MAHQVQHCVIGDGLEATLLALSLARLKQNVALVQTSQPLLESHAVIVAESNPPLASIMDTAHDLWPLLSGYKPALWRVQGMNAHRLSGGIVQTMTALGTFIREFKGHGGTYIQAEDEQSLGLTGFEGKVTGVNIGGDRINAEKVILANGVNAHTLAQAVGAWVGVKPGLCYSVGIAYAEHVMVPPIAVKLPQGRAYIFSDGPQHVQVIFIDKNQQQLVIPDQAVVTMLERLVAALLPKITWQPHDQVRVWLNAVSADGLPLAGPVEGAQGLWVCSGLGEYAGLLAPALAVTMAEALSGRPFNPALNDMMPARIQRQQVIQSQGSEVIKGEERLVAAPVLQSGEEHFVQPDGINIQRGEEHFVGGVQITRGEEHFVDTSSTIIRNTAQMVMEEEAKIKQVSVKMDEPAASGDGKVKLGSLKKETSDKKVTIGSLKK